MFLTTENIHASTAAQNVSAEEIVAKNNGTHSMAVTQPMYAWENSGALTSATSALSVVAM